MQSNDRILVKNETDLAYNGIYVYTSSTVLTRSTDFDTPAQMKGGDYVFVQNGYLYINTGWVMTTPVTTVGTDPVTWTEFSAPLQYTGSNGIYITGTQISANVDNVTTAIIGGNIAVANSAQLVTPNIGDATGNTLNLNANLTAGNISSNALTTTDSLLVNTYANVGNLITTGYGNIGTDFSVGGNANISGNVVIGTGTGGNISGINYIFSNVANITTDIIIGGNANITGNVTANWGYFTNDISTTGGNANIAANLIANNITSNYALTVLNGNVNFTTSPNVSLGSNSNVFLTGGSNGQVLQTDGTGNLSWYTVSTTSITNGTSNVSIPVTNGNVNLVSNGNTTMVITDIGANITGYANITGNLVAGNVSATTANLSAANVGTSVVLGNTTVTTTVTWASVTTSSVTANQTIASFSVTGVTGVEFFVKGVDQNGVLNKYSVATVQAVTDGTNVDYVTYSGAFLGSSPGSFAVNIVGSTIRLQVTPASSNTTVWTTQYRLI